jgi:hypothetical protein
MLTRIPHRKRAVDFHGSFIFREKIVVTVNTAEELSDKVATNI